MTDNEIIQEATEAVTKGLPCAFLVPPLLEVIERKNAEILELKEENANLKLKNSEFLKRNEKAKAEIERYLHSIKLLEKDVAQAKSEAYREFAKEFVDDLSHMLTYDKDYIKAKIFKLLESKQKELTESNE